MGHQSGTSIMKIIEKCDSRQHAGLQYEYKKIAHVSRRRAIKDARPLPVQHKVFHLLLEMLEKAIEENFMRQQHGDIWKVARTPEEAVKLLYETPVWDVSNRKFAAI